MSYVVDSNILLRMVQSAHPMHAEATKATTALLRNGETIHIVPQNLYEFWVVATRGVQYNGLGLSISAAQKELARLKSLFSFLPDLPAIYSEWERLVTQHATIGRESHDARIVAAMAVHGVVYLLTFNGNDFKRFQEIAVVSPKEVIEG